METINKLLKKQAPKTNARRKDLNGTDENPDAGMKPNPIFIRWTSNKDGNIISVPGEVTGGPLGPLFGTRMVQEVE
jgi:Ino eighty subunit 2